MKNTIGKYTAILVYVDDLLITGNNADEIKKTKEQLHKLFTIKDLGNAKYFLGLEIVRKKDGMYVNQRKYILDIISDAGLTGSKPVYTPLPREL